MLIFLGRLRQLHWFCLKEFSTIGKGTYAMCLWHAWAEKIMSFGDTVWQRPKGILWDSRRVAGIV